MAQTENIHCERMRASIPASYCGKHPVHCKGCDMLSGSKTAARRDFRAFFKSPITFNGTESLVQRVSAYGNEFWSKGV